MLLVSAELATLYKSLAIFNQMWGAQLSISKKNWKKDINSNCEVFLAKLI